VANWEGLALHEDHQTKGHGTKGKTYYGFLKDVCIAEISQLHWQSLACSAHILQLCILARLNISAIERLIMAVKKLSLASATVLWQLLEEKQHPMNISTKSSSIVVPLGVWNSMYEMFDHILKL